MLHVSEFLVPGFGRPVLLCRRCMPRARGMVVYVRDAYGAFRELMFECECCEMLISMACGVRQNFYGISIYSNSDLDDRICECLLTSMPAMQAEDVLGFFLFVCDLNGHHPVWFCFTTTNRYGVAAFDFATVTGCDPLVVGPTHARGGTVDLLMSCSWPSSGFCYSSHM